MSEDSKRRSKLEMYVAILDFLRKKPRRLTHIMYGTMINYDSSKVILENLINRKLVEVTYPESGDRPMYGITLDGINILKSFRELEKTIMGKVVF
jgi:predicted transcriptional regulator